LRRSPSSGDGRFPGGTDAMWVTQAHHIHTDGYDKFFGPGV
jgi:hypothetical protein